jgi:hypothetical protein
MISAVNMKDPDIQHGCNDYPEARKESRPMLEVFHVARSDLSSSKFRDGPASLLRTSGFLAEQETWLSTKERVLRLGGINLGMTRYIHSAKLDQFNQEGWDC